MKVTHNCWCGFEAKSQQGLINHGRLTKHDLDEKWSLEKENPGLGGCEHDWRPLSKEELYGYYKGGKTLKEHGFEMVCKVKGCGELR